MRIILYILVVIVAWLGLRHLIAIFTGQDRDGMLKQGQRLCHLVSLLILWASCAFSIYLSSFLPLIVGVISEHLFRMLIVWSGKRMNNG